MQHDCIVSDYDFNVKIENGILIARFLSDQITMKMAEYYRSEKIRLAEGKMFPILSDYRMVKTIDKEARAYISRKKSPDIINANAILIQNNTQELIGNIFIHFYKLKIPAQIFTNEAEALNWLEKFKV